MNFFFNIHIKKGFVYFIFYCKIFLLIFFITKRWHFFIFRRLESVRKFCIGFRLIRRLSLFHCFRLLLIFMDFRCIFFIYRRILFRHYFTLRCFIFYLHIRKLIGRFFLQPFGFFGLSRIKFVILTTSFFSFFFGTLLQFSLFLCGFLRCFCFIFHQLIHINKFDFCINQWITFGNNAVILCNVCQLEFIHGSNRLSGCYAITFRQNRYQCIIIQHFNRLIGNIKITHRDVFIVNAHLIFCNIIIIAKIPIMPCKPSISKCLTYRTTLCSFKETILLHICRTMTNSKKCLLVIIYLCSKQAILMYRQVLHCIKHLSLNLSFRISTAEPQLTNYMRDINIHIPLNNQISSVNTVEIVYIFKLLEV